MIIVSVFDCSSDTYCIFTENCIGLPITSSDANTVLDRFNLDPGIKFSNVHFEFPRILTVSVCEVRVITRSATGCLPSLVTVKPISWIFPAFRTMEEFWLLEEMPCLAFKIDCGGFADIIRPTDSSELFMLP